MQQKEQEEHMTLPEVAAALRVERHTVARMIGRGDLEGTKTKDTKQGHWRITTASYKRFTAPKKAAG